MWKWLSPRVPFRFRRINRSRVFVWILFFVSDISFTCQFTTLFPFLPFCVNFVRFVSTPSFHFNPVVSTGPCLLFSIFSLFVSIRFVSSQPRPCFNRAAFVLKFPFIVASSGLNMFVFSFCPTVSFFRIQEFVNKDYAKLTRPQKSKLNIRTCIWTSDCAMCAVKVRDVRDPRCEMWCNARGQDTQCAQPMHAIDLPIAQRNMFIF